MRTYGKIAYAPTGKWVINAEPHVNLRLKDLFRAVAKNQQAGLKLSDTPQACKDIAWFLTRYPLEISPADQERLTAGADTYDKRQDDLERILLPDYKPRALALTKPLRDYQGVAVDLLIANGGLLCGDDLGLGKTVVGIGAMVGAPEGLPACVLCQAHLTTQWRDKILEFAPNLRVHIVKTRKMYSLSEADVYIFTYSRIIGWDDLLRKGFFKMGIFDEVQELRIEGTAKYSSAEIIRDHATYMLGLSATPVYNYGGEIFAVANLLKKGCLGSRDEFIREWCDYSFSEAKMKVGDPEALGAYLRENFVLIRRRRKDVARELKPVNKIVHEVEYNEKTAETFRKDLKEIANRVLTGSFTERGQAARELDMQARMMTGVAKAQGVADYVRLLLESGEKVLLVGWHREVYETWLRELAAYKPVMYTGSESPAQKDASRDAFISGESPLLIMSLRSGIGVDGLQEGCSIVVFGELDWSPQVHEQIIGRLRRDGQTGQVMAIYLTSSNGTDPLMIDLLGLKASQAAGIMNPGDTEIIGNVVDEDRLKKLARSILDA